MQVERAIDLGFREEVEERQDNLGEKIVDSIKNNYIDVYGRGSLKRINRVFKREGLINNSLEDCYLHELLTENGDEVSLPKRIIELKRGVNPLSFKKFFEVKSDEKLNDPEEYKRSIERMREESSKSETYLCLNGPEDGLLLIFMAERKGTCLGRFNLS